MPFAARAFARPSLLTALRTKRPTFRPPGATRGVQYQRFGKGGQQFSRFGKTANFFQRWAARPTFYYEVGGVGALCGGFYIFNLETVEVSGRRRFNVVSEETVQSMAAQQEQQILQQYRGRVLSESDPRSKQVTRVLERLKPYASGLGNADWTVRVIDADEANAFVLPGGKVFIFTKMLRIAGDDNGIAAVLGHEIGHTVAKHVAEKMSQSFILYGALALASVLLGVDPSISNIALKLGFENPGSRKQESEADYIGLLMMSEACYDPRAAVGLWQKMQKIAQQEPPQFLSTHPSSANRERTIEGWLPEAQDRLDRSDCGLTTRLAGDFQSVVGGKW